MTVPGTSPRPGTTSRHHLGRHRAGRRCLAWAATGLLAVIGGPAAVLMEPFRAGAASPLLDQVKKDPGKGRALCSQFKALNAQGRKATDPASVQQVARQEGLSEMDAEILITYVIGIHCPDVR